mmetsp:Transcript_108728/g.192558  ORF Transcript_108728/g.192558 Transcript_108728/m.192558 type:complete len:150 (+) Transcript_108728:535-984(+)
MVPIQTVTRMQEHRAIPPPTGIGASAIEGNPCPSPGTLGTTPQTRMLMATYRANPPLTKIGKNAIAGDPYLLLEVHVVALVAIQMMRVRYLVAERSKCSLNMVMLLIQAREATLQFDIAKPCTSWSYSSSAMRASQRYFRRSNRVFFFN